MIDHASDLKLQHLVELSKLGDRCVGIEDGLRETLQQRDVVFAGHTIPFVLMPHFISPGQVGRVRRAVECLSTVLDRFCDAYPNDSRLREELALDAREDALVRLDPGYPGALRICRLDAFLAGYDVKFLEFNADSPAGIGYTDVLHRALDEAIELPAVRDTFDTAYEPMLPRLVETLLDAYRHARATDMPEDPALALVDAPGSPSVPEFRITCAAAGQAGLHALHATTEELDYDGSTLLAAGEPVHLVYRRALYEELDPDGPLVAAARDGRAVIVNPLRARVANNKKLFALLQDPRFADLVSRQEAEVIDATIPWTRVLRPGRVRYGDWVVDLLGFVADNRERLVLKPASDHGGRGVMLGIETDAGGVGGGRRRARRGRGLRRPGVRTGPRGDVPGGGRRPRRDAAQALQHQPLRHRRALRRHDHADLRPRRDQRVGRRRPAAQRGRPPQAPPAGRGGARGGACMRPRPEPLKRGYDVDDNAIRFSNYFHVLRALVHLHCGWLALEPSFERKYALGDHLHDDARSLSKVRRRLYELRHPSDYPGAPGDELAALLDRLDAADSPGAYAELAYGTVKPALVEPSASTSTLSTR